MIFLVLPVCVIAAIVVGVVVPKKATYNKLDKIGVVCNIVLAVLYVPMSLYGIFSLFTADSMSMYSEPVQNGITLLIGVGIALPFLSVAGILASVVLRKMGIRIWSFVIQFVPLILFGMMILSFELIYNFDFAL